MAQLMMSSSVIGNNHNHLLIMTADGKTVFNGDSSSISLLPAETQALAPPPTSSVIPPIMARRNRGATGRSYTTRAAARNVLEPIHPIFALAAKQTDDPFWIDRMLEFSRGLSVRSVKFIPKRSSIAAAVIRGGNTTTTSSTAAMPPPPVIGSREVECGVLSFKTTSPAREIFVGITTDPKEAFENAKNFLTNCVGLSSERDQANLDTLRASRVRTFLDARARAWSDISAGPAREAIVRQFVKCISAREGLSSADAESLHHCITLGTGSGYLGNGNIHMSWWGGIHHIVGLARLSEGRYILDLNTAVRAASAARTAASKAMRSGDEVASATARLLVAKGFNNKTIPPTEFNAIQRALHGAQSVVLCATSSADRPPSMPSSASNSSSTPSPPLLLPPSSSSSSAEQLPIICDDDNDKNDDDNANEAASLSRRCFVGIRGGGGGAGRSSEAPKSAPPAVLFAASVRCVEDVVAKQVPVPAHRASEAAACHAATAFDVVRSILVAIATGAAAGSCCSGGGGGNQQLAPADRIDRVRRAAERAATAISIPPGAVNPLMATAALMDAMVVRLNAWKKKGRRHIDGSGGVGTAVVDDAFQTALAADVASEARTYLFDSISNEVVTSILSDNHGGGSELSTRDKERLVENLSRYLDRQFRIRRQRVETIRDEERARLRASESSDTPSADRRNLVSNREMSAVVLFQRRLADILARQVQRMKENLTESLV